MKKLLERHLFISAAAAGLLIASMDGSFAVSPLKLEFVTHAAFFSAETKQPKTLDPQVFVEDAAALEATGPQGIKHVAGVRPPFIEQDAKTSKLFNADHKPLGFDLQSWLSAAGTVTISEKDGKVTLAVPSDFVVKLFVFPAPSIGVNVTGFVSKWFSKRL